MAVRVEGNEGVAEIHDGRRLDDAKAAPAPVRVDGVNGIVVRERKGHLTTTGQHCSGWRHRVPRPQPQHDSRVQSEHGEGYLWIAAPGGGMMAMAAGMFLSIGPVYGLDKIKCNMEAPARFVDELACELRTGLGDNYVIEQLPPSTTLNQVQSYCARFSARQKKRTGAIFLLQANPPPNQGEGRGFDIT